MGDERRSFMGSFILGYVSALATVLIVVFVIKKQ